jgi:hypothetical protein
LLDADGTETENALDIITRRLSIVNAGIRKALAPYPEVLFSEITATNQFVEIILPNEYSVQIAACIMNIDGKGELETVLKAIKNPNVSSVFADCIEKWEVCFTQKGKKLSKKGEEGDIIDKELLKLWVEFYHRFDTATKKERNQSEIVTDWEVIFMGQKTNKDGKIETINKRKKLAKDIYDLDHAVLDDLKVFLRLFAADIKK